MLITGQSMQNRGLRCKVNKGTWYTCTRRCPSESLKRLVQDEPRECNGSNWGRYLKKPPLAYFISSPLFSLFIQLSLVLSQTLSISLPLQPPPNPDTAHKTTVTPRFSIDTQPKPSYLQPMFIQIMNNNP